LLASTFLIDLLSPDLLIRCGSKGDSSE